MLIFYWDWFRIWQRLNDRWSFESCYTFGVNGFCAQRKRKWKRRKREENQNRTIDGVSQDYLKIVNNYIKKAETVEKLSVAVIQLLLNPRQNDQKRLIRSECVKSNHFLCIQWIEFSWSCLWKCHPFNRLKTKGEHFGAPLSDLVDFEYMYSGKANIAKLWWKECICMHSEQVQKVYVSQWQETFWAIKSSIDQGWIYLAGLRVKSSQQIAEKLKVTVWEPLISATLSIWYSYYNPLAVWWKKNYYNTELKNNK